MLSVQRRARVPDYSLCNQTVTLYRADMRQKTVTRAVLRGASYNARRNHNVEKTGSTAANSFLLVIPQSTARYGEDYTLGVEDKVLLGEGPQVSYEEWATFLPSHHAGLCAVKYIDVKYWQGAVCHVEAGG